MASMADSIEPYAVRTITSILGRNSFTFSRREIPPIPGMRTSVTSTSTGFLFIYSRASSAVGAVPTSPISLSTRTRPFTISGSSSTTKILGLLILFYTWRYDRQKTFKTSPPKAGTSGTTRTPLFPTPKTFSTYHRIPFPGKFSLNGQDHRKAATLAHLTLHLHETTVPLHDVLTCGKSQPGPRTLRLCSKKGLKEPGHMLGGYPRAIVLKDQSHGLQGTIFLEDVRGYP